MKFALYINFIKLNFYSCDLTINDMKKLYFINVNNAQYYVTFLNDYIKRFEIMFYNENFNIFVAFKCYKLYYKHENN